jgi:hypothetical protein
MFEYSYKLENGLVLIQAGELPTPGARAANRGQEPPCGERSAWA